MDRQRQEVTITRETKETYRYSIEQFPPQPRQVIQQNDQQIEQKEAKKQKEIFDKWKKEQEGDEEKKGDDDDGDDDDPTNPPDLEIESNLSKQKPLIMSRKTLFMFLEGTIVKQNGQDIRQFILYSCSHSLVANKEDAIILREDENKKVLRDDLNSLRNLNGDQLIDKLRERVQTDRLLKYLLEQSLLKAHAKQTKLNDYRRLYFNNEMFPTNLEDYFKFLKGYLRYRPEQSINMWGFDPSTNTHKEVLYRIIHFHFLIDQKVAPPRGLKESEKKKFTGIPQNHLWFQGWMILFSRAWGQFLDTPESIDEETIAKFKSLNRFYRVEDSEVNYNTTKVKEYGEEQIEFTPQRIKKPIDPTGWRTFNQFFARRLKTGLRPITSPNNNWIPTKPADSTFREWFKITQEGELRDAKDNKVTFKAKGMNCPNIKSLLKGCGKKYVDRFKGGVFIHYFLNTFSYHRFHSSVNGKIVQSKNIVENVYLETAIDKGDFDAPDNTDGGYEFTQARGLLIVDTAQQIDEKVEGDIGYVAMLPIGMSHVSSVVMTAKKNKYIKKGDEFGYFQFGASDIIILLEPKAGVTKPAKMLNISTKTGHDTPTRTKESEALRSRNYCFGQSIFNNEVTEYLQTHDGPPKVEQIPELTKCQLIKKAVRQSINGFIKQNAAQAIDNKAKELKLQNNPEEIEREFDDKIKKIEDSNLDQELKKKLIRDVETEKDFILGKANAKHKQIDKYLIEFKESLVKKLKVALKTTIAQCEEEAWIHSKSSGK